MAGIISWVDPHGLAAELGLEPQDKLVAINGQHLEDIIDYNYAMADDSLLLLVEKADGSRLEFLVEDKPPEEDLGLAFTANVFDGIRSCRNRCLFCFIDQLQPKPRASLLLKDDDYRMSFLAGNYITGSNLQAADLARITALRLSPLYVSVHTTDDCLRRRMLGNPQAAPILPLLKQLIVGGARLHTQIVLCPGINDGAQLAKTVADLAELYPGVASIAVVPVGLTRWQKNAELRLFTPAEACNLVAWVEQEQQKIQTKLAETKLLFAADEFYLKAGLSFPNADFYEDFQQLENGVGLAALFLADWQTVREFGELPTTYNGTKTAIITGRSGAPILQYLEPDLQRIGQGGIKIVPVKNSFYGPTVTVTGLLTGSCIKQAIKPGQYQKLIISGCMLKFDDDIFLDDLRVAELAQALETEIVVAENSAWGLSEALFGSLAE